MELQFERRGSDNMHHGSWRLIILSVCLSSFRRPAMPLNLCTWRCRANALRAIVSGGVPLREGTGVGGGGELPGRSSYRAIGGSAAACVGIIILVSSWRGLITLRSLSPGFRPADVRNGMIGRRRWMAVHEIKPLVVNTRVPS
jgi:hypothetical protein